jgi:predicted Abi (CAAX) family protease
MQPFDREEGQEEEDLHTALLRKVTTFEMRPLLNTLSERVVTSLTTFPVGIQGWYPIFGITAITTATAGVGAVATGFIKPAEDFSPPGLDSLWRPFSAFIMPGLLEELIWRAALLPTPSGPTTVSTMLQHATNLASIEPATLFLYKRAIAVLAIHICAHPVFSATVYPRGKQVFGDPRFLFLATIILGGTTLSYIVR